MAQSSSFSGLRLLIMVLAIGFFVYIIGPPLYWRFVGDEAARYAGCPECVNSCPDDREVTNAIADLKNVTLPACPQIDNDMADELQKTNYQKLLEEKKTQERVYEEEQNKASALLLETKKLTSHWQKEFEKCNTGMEDTEGAREKAEKQLALLKKTAALWEERARSSGWKGEEGSEKTEVTDEEPTKNEETEELSNVDVEEEKGMPTTSKDGPKIARELKNTLETAGFVVQRAVHNEMGTLKGARQHASQLNLL